MRKAIIEIWFPQGFRSLFRRNPSWFGISTKACVSLCCQSAYFCDEDIISLGCHGRTWAVIFNQSSVLESPPWSLWWAAKRRNCSPRWHLWKPFAALKWLQPVIDTRARPHSASGCGRSFTLSSDRKRLSHPTFDLRCVKSFEAARLVFIIEFIHRAACGDGGSCWAGNLCVIVWFTLRFHKRI